LIAGEGVDDARFDRVFKNAVNPRMIFIYVGGKDNTDVIERFRIWREGVLIIVPFIFGAITTVGTHVFLGNGWISAVIGLLVTCISPLLLLGLLVYPATEVVRTRKVAAEGHLAEQRRYYANSISKSTELTNAIRMTSTQLNELQSEIARLELIASREYQLKQLYDRNWKAMRSIEFEQFLEEVFTILGYSVETTAVTGDQGVDLIVEKRGVRIAVQVKGYLNSVSNAAVQEAFAGMAHYSCDALSVITNSGFQASAVSLSQTTLGPSLV